MLWKYRIDGWVESVSIAPDGKYIVAGSGYKDKHIYLFNRERELFGSIEQAVVLTLSL